ncbi:uncharacterized protein PHACADRAFT_263182 [Phanerochaete carnosa HHB-10118-sp]|uniref:Uncharacterized protein n=1 Tax=Phanerochaete carnosa (strain HHB-10118-sp) TaxID=650164 RepID=K5WLK4_PHACS|nr:uncharacterized protein PHACADRAFT_263182 [Phanerochaete carnosa HHB-10118-sp]EKM51177.1 hypothetical protein PHACADRAFT_263182 [Phanerochaete carnosa HHB-10118-sp]
MRRKSWEHCRGSTPAVDNARPRRVQTSSPRGAGARLVRENSAAQDAQAGPSRRW